MAVAVGGGPAATHPQVLLAEHRLAKSIAHLAQARAQKLPAVSASLGVWRFTDATADSDQAYVLGFSVPLQFSARNAEGIASARADKLRANWIVNLLPVV